MSDNLNIVVHEMCGIAGFDIPMHQNTTFLPILSIFQAIFNKLPSRLEFPKQVFIIDIINLNTQMLILFPVFKILEVIFQYRDDVCDARILQSGLSSQREDSVQEVNIDSSKLPSKRLKQRAEAGKGKGGSKRSITC